jgi:uncharacterized protein
MPAESWPLLVFARAAVVGQVKTRLIPELGADGACNLHRQLMSRTLQRACAARGAHVQLWIGGDPTEVFVQECSRRYCVPVFEQRGADLGRRMAEAFDHALRSANPTAGCVLIGTDCPAQTVKDLEDAHDALRSHDAVLQPAEDGGYVLIGLRRPLAQLFDAIDWGSEHVTEQTSQRAAVLGLTLHALRTVPDLDSSADLQHARARGWIEA